MNVDRRYFLSLLCMTPVSALAQQQGFAGLGSAAEGFAPVVPGRQITFPKDHGAHPAVSHRMVVRDRQSHRC